MKAISLAVTRWQLTLVAFLLVALLGVYAFVSIPRSVDPHFPIPLVIVTTVLPGADAGEIEETVTKPIEAALQGLDHVREIESTSVDGVAIVSVDFVPGTDAEQALDRAVREVNSIRRQLPDGIVRLEARRARTTDTALLQLALVSETASWRRMDKYAQDLRDRLNATPGVRNATISGMAAPEVRVELDMARLADANLPATRVANAVAAGGTDMPIGSVESAGRRLNVEAGGAYRSLAAVKAVPLRGGGGQLLTVGDVAKVDWAEAEHLHLARLNGQRAVWISVQQKDNVNAVDVRDELRATIAEFQPNLPPDIALSAVFDQSRDIERRLNQLSIDFAIALALVLVTLLPLGFRASLVVMLSIPTSLAIGMLAMHWLGYTLNQLTIAGFIVSLGLLVDDSIVVTENIGRHLRMGEEPTEAAINASSEIAYAVMGSTGVLIFAFLPIANLPEMAGDFVRGLPMAVLVSVAASLVVAMTIVPFVASRMLRVEQNPRGNRFLQWLTDMIARFYRPILRLALDNPNRTVWGSMIACVAMLASIPVIGFSLFPTADVPYFKVLVETSPGSSIRTTDSAVRKVADMLSKTPEITARIENVGRGNPQIFYNNLQRENDTAYGEIFVTIEEWSPRDSPKMIERLRQQFSDFPDARVTVVQFDQGPPIAASIEISLRGPDLGELKRLAGEVASVIRQTPGTRDIDNPVALDRIDLDLNVDEAKSGLLNVAPDAVRRTVRLALSGEAVSQYRDAEGDSYPVVVRLPLVASQPVSALKTVYVPSLTERAIPLSLLTSPQLNSVPPRINRFQQERFVTVAAHVKEGFLASKVTSDVMQRIDKIPLPSGYRFVIGGEAKATARSTNGLGWIFAIAVFGIFGVLVAEFGRFREVVVVLGVVPLGLFGGLVALLISGYSLSFLAVVGFVALVGIEIKNSILLVDFTKQLLEQGVQVRDAIEKAGEIRFVPVLLTSLTAIGGLLPLALSGAPLYAPLAWVIIGGLLSSTLLSRVVTPTMYLLIARQDVKNSNA